ncbi:MAG TPA: glycosyltransferase, partial [Gemmatimonadaceae bacterium]|nr:glycosyltransferase [Gemmatimonadaceae bacterium]
YSAPEANASVALVHDYLLVLRGAERTFAAIAACWPEAPIHTLLHDAEATAPMFGGRTVHTSYLERLGIRQDGFRRLLPLFPTAARRMKLAPHDVVISSSSAFAHGVDPAPGADHICYCHTPFRYAWHERDRALAEVPRALRPAMRGLLARVRRWDLEASRRVTHYIANSAITRERIAQTYGRDVAIVHPPVDVDRFAIGEPEDFFLIATEVVPHKRVELALQAARSAGVQVKVVGSGPDVPRLRELYGDSARFMGHVSDTELTSLFQRARALIVPNVEEFGIAAVEAQAAGRPVVAADAGGVRETVLPGSTGVLVKSGDVDDLAEALRYTDFDRFDPLVAKMNAERFSQAEFQRRFVAEVEYATGGRVLGQAPDAPPDIPSQRRRFTRSASS